jgi:hypothetical protein
VTDDDDDDDDDDGDAHTMRGNSCLLFTRIGWPKEEAQNFPS